MFFRFGSLLAIAASILLCGCSGDKLVVGNVAYQSIRTEFDQDLSIPQDANIAVGYVIGADGKINVVVKNLTTEIMTIDQTKSFFINTDGTSTSYFDPTVTTKSTTNYSIASEGASFNLGGLTRAFGIGGIVGSLAQATTVSGSETNGLSNTTTTYLRDMPEVSIGPRGSGAMSKIYKITGVGSFSNSSTARNNVWTKGTSPLQFSVCISYRIGNDGEWEKLVTNFYVNSEMVVNVQKGAVNDAFRSIYANKPDALSESAYLFKITNNLESSSPIYDNYSNCTLVDYQ
jgi:hypothetical protein